VIWREDGQVVTNAHVLHGNSIIEVELWNGRRLRADIRNSDPRRDLAALQVDAQGVGSAIPGDSDALRPGELVIAVGSPYGFIGAVSTGVIHSVGALSGLPARPWVVSDVRLAPGNSGGPLANAQGHVVGLNTMIAGGLAIAIPSKSVGRFLAESASGRRAYLGVTAQPVDGGFLVLEIAPGSPAERASLLPGDLLVAGRGRPFRSAEDLEEVIHSSYDGQLEIEFRRGSGRELRKVVVQVATQVSMEAVRAA
jgi:serine protease Do